MEIGHVYPVNQNLTRCGTFQHVDTTHQSAFSRTAHADNAKNVSVMNGQVYILERFYRAVFRRKGFA